MIHRCRSCGDLPSVSSDGVQAGQGCYLNEWRVTCRCGMSGPKFDTYASSDARCQKLAIAAWNKAQGGLLSSIIGAIRARSAV